jgi:hypothetical protein
MWGKGMKWLGMVQEVVSSSAEGCEVVWHAAKRRLSRLQRAVAAAGLLLSADKRSKNSLAAFFFV